jgi:hypothetical protein
MIITLRILTSIKSDIVLIIRRDWMISTMIVISSSESEIDEVWRDAHEKGVNEKMNKVLQIKDLITFQ